MTIHHGLVLALAAVACGGAPPPAPPLVTRAAPVPAPTRITAAAPAAAETPWQVLQTYLPALRGLDPDAEFRRIGAYAPSRDADATWRQLALDLAAADGALDRTCAHGVAHFLALVVDDPASTSSIGRREPEVRVFWMPLRHVAGMTVAQAIRAAGLVDGPDAQELARGLRESRGDAWVAALEASAAWFLPAGDDPSVHPRRVRGYAVATAAALRSYLVYVGASTVGGFCEVATVAIDRLDDMETGPIHGGGDALCELAGTRGSIECRR
jgi:hypothetical protein